MATGWSPASITSRGRDGWATGILLVVSSTHPTLFKGPTPISSPEQLMMGRGFELFNLWASTAASMPHRVPKGQKWKGDCCCYSMHLQVSATHWWACFPAAQTHCQKHPCTPPGVISASGGAGGGPLGWGHVGLCSSALRSPSCSSVEQKGGGTGMTVIPLPEQSVPRDCQLKFILHSSLVPCGIMYYNVTHVSHLTFLASSCWRLWCASPAQ